MSYGKSFPKEIKGNGLQKWEEVSLSLAEENSEEEKARKENMSVMKQCLDDAASIMQAKKMQQYQSDKVLLAITLFGKRASHVVYWKDRKCKDKFDGRKQD